MIDHAGLIVTVCSRADANCPIIPSGKRKIHLSFDDPSNLPGTEQEIRAAFDRACLEIRAGVERLLDEAGSPPVPGLRDDACAAAARAALIATT